jgi:hypothetical protein
MRRTFVLGCLAAIAAGCASTDRGVQHPAESPRPKTRVALFVSLIGADEEETSLTELAMRGAREALAYAEDVAVVDAEPAPIIDCAANTECIVARLRARAIDLGIVIVQNMSESPPLLSGRVIDADTGQVLKNALLESERTGIESAIRSTTMSLLEAAGHRIRGRVRISRDPSNVRIEIDGAATAGEASDLVSVAPGTHRWAAFSDGYAERSASFEVRRGETAEISVLLDRSPSILESGWLWLGVAAIVAAGAGIAFIALRPHGGGAIRIHQEPPP